MLFAKQRVSEVGLPDHLTGRMSNIILKNSLGSPQPANQPTTSTDLDEKPALIARKTKYSTLRTPSQRKAVVKRNLANALVASLLDSSEEENGRQEKQQTIDHAKEAQPAHQKMCRKAMDTTNNVNNLLTKTILR